MCRRSSWYFRRYSRNSTSWRPPIIGVWTRREKYLDLFSDHNFRLWLHYHFFGGKHRKSVSKFDKKMFVRFCKVSNRHCILGAPIAEQFDRRLGKRCCGDDCSISERWKTLYLRDFVRPHSNISHAILKRLHCILKRLLLKSVCTAFRWWNQDLYC